MSTESFYPKRVLVWLSLAIAYCCTPYCFSQLSPKILNPQTYASQSGQYAVHVDPSDIYGRNSATYQFKKDGIAIWSKQLPTLWDVGISDDGVIAGYGYTNGPDGFGTDDSAKGPGSFHVMVIDSDGNVLCTDSKKRIGSRFLHTNPNPLATGMIFDGPNDRFVVRIADSDVNRNKESWQVYSLSTGKAIDQYEPAKHIRNSQNARLIINAQPISETPLTLVHWWRYDGGRVGARFAALDLKGKPVWSLELESDYEVPGNEDAEDKLREYVRRESAIFRSVKNHQFQLLFARESQKVTFAVERTKHEGWKIKEVNRVPTKIPLTVESPDAQVVEELRLKSLGVVELQSTESKAASVINGVTNIELDGKKRISYIKNIDDSDDVFIVVDENGKQLHRVPLNVGDNQDARWSGYAWVGGDRYVLTRSSYKLEAKAKAWIIDLPTGKLIPLPNFDCPSVDEIAGTSNGNFFALATLRHKYTSESTVFAFDSTGKRKWSLDQGYSKKLEKLFSPKDLAITSTGEVAVLDVIRHSIQLFDLRGKYLRTIELEKAWGRKPNYPSGIAAGLKGGFVVTDFQGTSPVVKMRPDGSVIAGLQPKYKDGRNVDAKNLRVSEDGQLWTCDGYAALRLDDSGVVDRVLGAAPNANRLGKIATLTIDRHGSIYAADSRTNAVSVFDRDGRLLHVCVPEPTDVSEKLWRQTLAVNNEGHVFLSVDDTRSESSFVHFSESGERLGVVKFKTQDWHFQPRTKNGLALGFENAYLIDPNGKLLRKISRRADGNWLENPRGAAFARDGSFAVSADHSRGEGVSINIYDKDGTPASTITMPSEIRYPNLAFDGKNLVVGSLDTLYYCSVSKGNFYKLTPSPVKGKHVNLQPYFGAGRDELLIFDGSGAKLYRYSMPN